MAISKALSTISTFCLVLVLDHGVLDHGIGRTARGSEPVTKEIEKLASRIREPEALLLVDAENRLLVANERSGSISVIDTSRGKVLAEIDLGQSLVDLATLPDGRHLFALDRAKGTLLLLDRQDLSIQIAARLPVSADPVKLLVTHDGTLCVVASRWSRRITVIELASGDRAGRAPSMKIAQTIELPFGPREMLELPGECRILVADAFGGKLALVDPHKGAVMSIRSVPDHNIRGLVLASGGKAVIIAHETLNSLARSTFDDIHWGLLVGHHLQVIPLDFVREPGADLLAGSRLFELGEVGRAAGDPSCLCADTKGNLMIALGGVNELAITSGPGKPARRVPVGRRPIAAVTSSDGKTSFVANHFDDTISVVDNDGGRVAASIALGPAPALRLIDRGKQLFYDARLSHDGWMSCHSCHTDGHTNGLLSDTLADASYGAPKRVPSLLGVGVTPPWTWTGLISRLEDQVHNSIENTMHGPKDASGTEHVEALTAFIRSLSPPAPALADSQADQNAAVLRGRQIFQSRKCDACHVPPSYTSSERFDVGLSDEVGNRQFNPPSLRGVGQREPFLHDGRARSLEDLFHRHRHPRENAMTPADIADLVAFLKTL
jgi:YVTN family beta-propeller protein